MKTLRILLLIVVVCTALKSNAEPVIYINQVAFDSNAPKIAVIGVDVKFDRNAVFTIVDAASSIVEFSGKLSDAQELKDWAPGKIFYRANFSAVKTKGNYRLRLIAGGKSYSSGAFVIEDNALANLTIPAIIHYYHKQRADKPEEVAADKHVILFGSSNTVDVHGGWCDASGDISKYFSHLAYANFMSPQQIPLVTWSMENTSESKQKLLTKLGVKDSLDSEAIWGADFIMRSLSKEDYFYETIFSYFSKNPNDRRIVGLRANSVTTDQYQAAFREGGGMAIAALARISRWKKDGDFTSQQYLDAAKHAFAHLLVNNTKYDDDGKENIIDDYCALMAATELWIATDSSLYRDEARKRAHNLEKRISPGGYFISDDGSRPFWHASDAGLPVVALCRYLKKENDQAQREAALNTVKTALLYTLRVTNDVSNPFGYARQTFRYQNQIKEGFFIPHENETGWWWQGEDARLSSLATAATEGGKLAFPAGSKTRDSLAAFVSQQLSWILGCNPYNICLMYGFGQKNVPYMHSMFGHGSEKGGISNGITGKDGNPDGSGIDFKTEAEGNEWRWTEQWLPHAAWFLAAVTASTSGD